MVKHNYDGGLSCYFLFLYDSSSDKKTKRNIVLEIADNVRIRIDKSSIYATAADSTTTNQA